MNPRINPIKPIQPPTKLKLQNGIVTSKVKTNHQDSLSKAGLSNVNSGTREVLRNQFKAQENPLLKINEGTVMTESKTIRIPLKALLLEEGLTEHIRNNANKYAGGALVAGGLAAGNFLGDGNLADNVKGAFSGNDNGTQPNQPSNNPPLKLNTQDDHFKNDLNINSNVVTNTNVDSNPGIFGALKAGFNHTGDTLRTANKHDALTDAQQEYKDIKNGEGDLLTTGQMAAIGGVGAAGYAASRLGGKLRRR